MYEYEQILLDFANKIRYQESFKYNICEIADACIVGAHAIKAIKELQNAIEKYGVRKNE